MAIRPDFSSGFIVLIINTSNQQKLIIIKHTITINNFKITENKFLKNFK